MASSGVQGRQKKKLEQTEQITGAFIRRAQSIFWSSSKENNHNNIICVPISTGCIYLRLTLTKAINDIKGAYL